MDEEHNNLYNQRWEKIKDFEPKVFLQRIRKVNKSEIYALHRDLDRVDNRIIHEHRDTPNREEVPRIQKEMSVLHGAFKELDRAFQEIGRQGSHTQQEERMHRVRQQEKCQEQDSDRGWER